MVLFFDFVAHLPTVGMHNNPTSTSVLSFNANLIQPKHTVIIYKAKARHSVFSILQGVTSERHSYLVSRISYRGQVITRLRNRKHGGAVYAGPVAWPLDGDLALQKSLSSKSRRCDLIYP